MTNTLLQINSGLRGSNSQSSILAGKLAASILPAYPGMRHIRRDLSTDPVPHLSRETFDAFLDPAAAESGGSGNGLALSDLLIDELMAADVLVIGAPMYNLMVPSTLKAWIDHVTRTGRTFRFTENGPIGLLENTKAYVAIAQGGSFLGTPDDVETVFLRNVLNLIGITEIEFVYAKGLAFGPEAAAAAIDAADRQIQSLCAASY